MASQLLVHSAAPYNAEPPLARLRAAFCTAQSDLYVRNHGPVPHPDAAAHRVSVTGLVARPLSLDVAELRARFPERHVRAVMQCAGNRRADLARVRPVTGDPWAGGAIGHVAWDGVRLADVLEAAGARRGAGLHVAFEALDECEADGERFRFAVSIPMRKALAPEVLLAWGMNGEPLTPGHGFPLRVVVPGYAGVRSPKWLSRITVQDAPGTAKPQARDYKLLPPHVTKETVDWSEGVTIDAMPLTSAICEPAPHAELPPGRVTLRGYAIASARAVVRVDVSIDGGGTWRQAALERDADSPWSWTFWEIEVALAAGAHELVVRAWDETGQTQPARPDEVWNFKGYLSTAWHRVPVLVVPAAGR